MAALERYEIEVRAKAFPAVGEAAALTVLRDVTVGARPGEFVCLFGPSGCGKTTLLNIIAGLDDDFEGSRRFPPGAEGRPPRVGYVFQTPRLLPWRSVRQNLELPLEAGQIASGIVDELLAVTGLSDFANTYPQRLSVGMRRRVSLARAFAIQPELLLMDEPFVSLDAPTARRLQELLIAIWRERPTTVFFVTHDLTEAVMLGDRILLLSGTPATVAADLAVELPREARGDGLAVDAVRRRLVADHPTLAGSD